MRCFEVIDNGYILAIGTGNGHIEIDEERYNTILSVIRSKPPRTETTDYRLTLVLTWEPYPIDPPDPDPELDDSELLDILMGGAE